jgi:hypothetical protein
MARLKTIIEVFGMPDVWTIRPTTFGEMDPVLEMKKLRPSKAAIISAMEDMDREGCPMDAEELASEFGISTSDIEQILSEEDEV